MHCNYTPAIKATLAKETVISVLFNALVPAGIIWLLDVAPPRSLFGPDSILPPLIFGAGIATFGMTLVLTTIIRARLASGGLPNFDWPRDERGRYRWIPQKLLLRALALAAFAIVILVPAGLATAALTGILPLTKTGLLVFNLIYGTFMGMLMTRLVVLPALADGFENHKDSRG